MIAAFLIHGFATTTDDFASIIPFLKKRYDAIFLDNLPGHGSASNMELFTVENVFNGIEQKFEEIKSQYDKVDVYGFSMGGALASYLGSRKDINRLILFAPANAFISIRSFGRILKKDIAYSFIDDSIDKEVFRLNNKKSIDMMFKQLLPNYSLKSIATFTRVVKKCNQGLVESNVPTLLIRGDMDELVPDRASKIIKKYFPNTQEYIISDLGHLMLYSRKHRLIINKVKKFLDESN